MKYSIVFALIFMLFLSCSDDDSNASSQDDRFKLIFDMDGSGAIIGDKSNTLIKRVYNSIDGIVMTSNFSFNPYSRNFYFPGLNPNTGKTVLHRANILSILKSEDYYYQTTELSILSSGEQFLKAFVNWDDAIFVIYKNPANSVSLKKLNSGQLEYSQSLSNLYQIADNFKAYHLHSINKLVLVSDAFLNKVGVVLDMNNKDNVQQFTLPKHINLFNVAYDGNGIYFISKESSVVSSYDNIYDIEGNLISSTSNTIATSALGYDVQDSQLEYVERGDGRKEAGTINVESGELNFTGIAGETGFHRSRLFFFDR